MNGPSPQAATTPEAADAATTLTPAAPSASADAVPVRVIEKADPDQIVLRLLLVNGQKSDVAIDPALTVAQVRERIFEQWPSAWARDAETAPVQPASLRILHRGRFLDGPGTLEAEGKVPRGEITTVHILVKNPVVGDDAPGAAPDLKPKEGDDDEHYGCRCCSIM